MSFDGSCMDGLMVKCLCFGWILLEIFVSEHRL